MAPSSYSTYTGASNGWYIVNGPTTGYTTVNWNYWDFHTPEQHDLELRRRKRIKAQVMCMLTSEAVGPSLISRLIKLFSWRSK